MRVEGGELQHSGGLACAWVDTDSGHEEILVYSQCNTDQQNTSVSPANAMTLITSLGWML